MESLDIPESRYRHQTVAKPHGRSFDWIFERERAPWFCILVVAGPWTLLDQWYTGIRQVDVDEVHIPLTLKHLSY